MTIRTSSGPSPRRTMPKCRATAPARMIRRAPKAVSVRAACPRSSRDRGYQGADAPTSGRRSGGRHGRRETLSSDHAPTRRSPMVRRTGAAVTLAVVVAVAAVAAAGLRIATTPTTRRRRRPPLRRRRLRPPPQPPPRRPPPRTPRSRWTQTRTGSSPSSRSRWRLPPERHLPLHQRSAVPHNLAIQGDGVEEGPTATIAGGEAANLKVEPEAGDLQFFCAVPGHEQAAWRERYGPVAGGDPAQERASSGRSLAIDSASKPTG